MTPGFCFALYHTGDGIHGHEPPTMLSMWLDDTTPLADTADLMDESNAERQAAAAEPFRAIATHTATSSGHPRHQAPDWPRPEHTYLTNRERAAIRAAL